MPIVDTRGKTVSTYVIGRLLGELEPDSSEEPVELITDNHPGILSDLDAWSRLSGYAVAPAQSGADEARFNVSHRADVPEKARRSFAVVISNAGLEELLSPLGFALGAAQSGLDVSVYFQGPAVRVLSRGFKAHLGGIWRPFSAFARRGMAKTGHVDPQQKLAELIELGATIYVCGPSMEHFGVKAEDFAFEGIQIAEYITFIEVMASADAQIYT